MNLYSGYKTAYKALFKNKTRSFLTTLGIVIGVSSVITMLAIGQGSSDSIKDSIRTMGTNVIMVFPAASSRGGVRQDVGSSVSFKEEQVKDIKDNCPSVAMASPVIFSGAQTVSGSSNWQTRIYGVYSEYSYIRDYEVEFGSFFTPEDDRKSTKVCVIGKTVSDNLFGANVNPVGQTIRINRIPFRIVGVLESKGGSMMGQDQDDLILAPFSTVKQRILPIDYIHLIYASAVSENAIDRAVTEIENALTQSMRVGSRQEKPFNVRTQSEIIEMVSSTSRILMILLASIAVISLIVGGIGIMNIMLVSVTERTREIGLRMAVGATGRDILAQFLIEAVLLSLIGGLAGILLGVSASLTLSKILNWPVVITPYSIILSFSFASLIGIFFGWYPAKKASSLIPIEALRYE
ncbi:ABC transporter permease [candidate division WOR-3 bacterium]|nr:ABC transporter permease [candidate division WOR-3 bacterium]